jgi:integrase
MAQTNTITPLNELFSLIIGFLKLKGNSSENTARTYKNGIQTFYNKPIQFLTVEDIHNTDLETFENFIQEMKENNEYNNKTIRLKMTSVKELIKYISWHKDGTKITGDINYLNGVTELAKTLPEKDNYYGNISVEDVRNMSKWILENEREKADVKSYLVLFALDTSSRIGSCVNLQWNDFGQIDESGEVPVHFIGKGNSDTYKKINANFYTELLSLKKKYNSKLLFPISASAIRQMIKRWREANHIPESKNIKFHSIRGTGAVYAFKTNGNDPVAAKEALNHKNLNNINHYVKSSEIHATGAVSMSYGLDQDLYKKVDHNLLLQAIEKVPEFKLMLNLRLNEMMKNKQETSIKSQELSNNSKNNCQNVIKWI